VKHKTKKSRLKIKNNEIRLKKTSESIESLRAKMDNFIENPEEGLEASIEIIKRFGCKKGWG